MHPRACWWHVLGGQVGQVAPSNAGTALNAAVWQIDASGRSLSTLSCTDLLCSTVHHHADIAAADYDGVGRAKRI